MSFNDVFKKSFLNNMSMADFTAGQILIIFGVTMLLSLYIFFIYRIFSRKNFYNKSFNVALAATAMITAAVIVTIQSSIVVSLGMVGALSIVRFRTAVKDPLDLVFMFWALAVGIICGVGLFDIAGILSALVTIMIFVLDRLPVAQSPMILMVQGVYCDLENDISSIVSEYTKFYKVKSRNITPERTSIVMELRIKDGGGLVQRLGGIDGVEYVSIIDHDGEVTY
ncbi:MAG: DUF4956 domain-containing protein [Lachnospiraceae bacterium]|nr:DUF4956 domain-containing protein [Lachnospiraceae bacterium]